MPNFMDNFRKNLKSSATKDNSLQHSHHSISLTDKEKLEKFNDVLKQISNNKGNPNSKGRPIDNYLSATGDYSNSTSPAASAVDHVADLGVDMSNGLRGIALGFFAYIDAKNTISLSKQNKRSNLKDTSLKYSLKKLPDNPQRLLIKKNISFKSIDLSKTNHEEIVDKIINLKKYNPTEVKKLLDLAVALKERKNNEFLINTGLEMGFVNYIENNRNSKLNSHKVDSSKIPDAISKIEKKIEELTHSNNGHSLLGHGVGHEVKLLKETIKKLKLIQVYDNIKTIHDLRNNNASSNKVLNSLKVTGDVIGFSGEVGILAAPISAPVSMPLLASGLILRASSTLGLFIKNKLQERNVNQKLEHAKVVDKDIKNKAKNMIDRIDYPTMATNYPRVFKLFNDSLNEIDNKYSFNRSSEELILEKFEEKVNANLSKNPKLSEEWDSLKGDWDSLKKDIEKAKIDQSLRALCEKPIHDISKYLMTEIKTLKDFGSEKNINQELDKMIYTSNLLEILSLAGIQKQGISPSDFISKTINAIENSDSNCEKIASETVKDIDVLNLFENTDIKKKELLESGKSMKEVEKIISQELESILRKKILAGNKKVDESVDPLNNSVLQDKLEKSIKSLL